MQHGPSYYNLHNRNLNIPGLNYQLTMLVWLQAVLCHHYKFFSFTCKMISSLTQKIKKIIINYLYYQEPIKTCRLPTCFYGLLLLYMAHTYPQVINRSIVIIYSIRLFDCQMLYHTSQ